MQTAGEKLVPITLELGGKDPMIVLEDANLERAAAGAIWGVYEGTKASLDFKYGPTAGSRLSGFRKLVALFLRSFRRGVVPCGTCRSPRCSHCCSE